MALFNGCGHKEFIGEWVWSYPVGTWSIFPPTPWQVLFVHVDTADDASDRVSEFFGIEDDLPTCRLINMEEDMKKFVPDFEGIGPDDIRSFVSNYLEGNLKVRWNLSIVVTCQGGCYREEGFN